MATSLILSWHCPSGCAQARELIGRLIKEHLRKRVDGVAPMPGNKFMMRSNTLDIKDLEPHLDSVGITFTSQRPAGSVAWKTTTGESAQYLQGKKL